LKDADKVYACGAYAALYRISNRELKA